MKKKLLALFLALVMVGAVLPGCGDGSKDPGGQGNNGKTGEPVKGGEITVGIAQDLDDSLDPHQTVAAGTREVLFNIFEGLVKPNSDGEMIPAVAEKYTLSEDGTTYTFTLRDESIEVSDEFVRKIQREAFGLKAKRSNFCSP